MVAKDDSEKALESIIGYKRLSPLVATAGQPARGQFRLIRKAGFDLVVNLATDKSTGHIPEEPNIVRKLGMDHIHIPVAWDDPKSEDFEAFSLLMDSWADGPVFVHCAKNWRVSAFMYLYRVLRQGMDQAKALWDLREVWEPDTVWSGFIGRMLEQRAD